MSDFKRKRAQCKGQVTKIQKQTDSLLLMESKLREPQHVNHLAEEQERSAESYLLSYQQFLDDADEMGPKKQEEEEANHEDFMRLIESAQILLCHMRERAKALQPTDDIEDMDVDHFKGTLDASWFKLQEDLEAFKLSTSLQEASSCQSCDSITETSGGSSLSCGCCLLKNLSLWMSLPTRKEI